MPWLTQDREGRPVEQRGGEHVQGVEPAPGLADVLDDEVARVVAVEPLAVFERVVHLGERHRPRLKPAVEHLGDPAHHGLAGRVVRVRPDQVVDRRTVQVGRAHAEVALELRQRAVHVGARVVGVVALPDRDGRAPEPVPADRPVPRAGQPLAELAALDVLGHPGDLLVQLDHPVPERAHRDEPARHRLVDQRVAAPPAVRVGVRVGFLPHQAALLAQPGREAGVGVEHVLTLEVGHHGGEPGAFVHGEHGRDAGRVAARGVGLAVGGRHVHHAGAVLGGDVVGQDHPERVLGAELRGVGQVTEQRLVAAPGQLGAGQRADLGGALELPLVGGLPVPGQDVPLAVLGDHHVADVRADRAGQVGRQGPRRGGPGQQPLPGLQLEPDRHRGVLPFGVGVVVHPQLVVGQRGLAPPAVRQDLEALVDQALVPQLLERPHDALHVGEVERLVVVVEVDPAGLPGDVVAPFAGVAQHGLAAGVVELLDAHGEDVGLAGDAEQAFGLDLGGQPVAVPAEPALHPVPLHGPEPGYHVFDVAGDQVTVVRQPVGERRAVVEDELAVGRPLADRGAERVRALPVVKHLALERGEARLGGYFGVPGTRVDGHRCVLLGGARFGARTTRPLPRGRTAVPPRLPPGPCPGPSPATARQPAMTGRTRPVLVRPRRDPFFRGLPGDSRIIATSAEAYLLPVVFRAPHPPGQGHFRAERTRCVTRRRRRARARWRASRRSRSAALLAAARGPPSRAPTRGPGRPVRRR